MGDAAKVPEFQLGLAMAGAISAGAYSAGVFDFLIQALEAWDQARDEVATKSIIPTHRVGLKVIVGASAGAITGALGAVAMAGKRNPVEFVPASMGQQYKCVLPNLYDAWVARPDMVSPDGKADFLQCGDLANSAPVVSALNSEVLTSIKTAAIALKESGPPLPYVSNTLDIYLTMSNLRGVPYSVSFRGGNYGMMSHGDRAHYRVTGLGTWESRSAFADNDQKRDLDVKDLFPATGPSDDWKLYALAAVTSGAFPIGLAAVQWATDADEYRGRNWPIADAEIVKNHMIPSWPFDWPGKGKRPFSFTAVDGGLINNEPFEYARYTLMAAGRTTNERDGELADRAVIMIDPFPEAPPFPPDGQPTGDLLAVLMTLIPALRKQAQFKPSEVAVAASDNVFSRFLIAPHRTPPESGQTEEIYAIASGLIGGFGGFLARSFREHDFQLGRRNCQKFLADSFALFESNLLFATWPSEALANPDFRGAVSMDKQTFKIIPLLGSAALEVPYPDWPQISEDDVATLQTAIRARVQKLAAALIAERGSSWKMRRILKLGFSLGKGNALRFIALTILSDLVRRNQIKEWSLPATWARAPKASGEEVRLVIAALLNPKFDYRNEAGVVNSTGLSFEKVRDILSSCQAQTGSRFEVWRAPYPDRSGNPVYTLASRKPSVLSRIPGIRQFGNWITAPTVDPPGI